MQRSAMLVAFLLAAVLASGVNGQSSCLDFTTEQTCYDNRASLACAWNPSTSTCSVNYTPTCADLYRDTVGCAARMECAINNNNNVCYAFPECPALSLESECSKLPSTCTWDGASCLNSWTGCATHSSDGFACESNACAYDVFAPTALPKCLESFAESKSMYPDCRTWSNYPGLSAEEACVSHGCSFSSTTKLCQPLGSGGSTDAPSASLDIKFEVGSFQQVPGTTEFDFRVIVPFAQFFDPSAPAWHAITIGTPPSNVPGVATQPSQCNSLLTAFPAFGTGQPVASTHSSYSTLTNYFVSNIDAANQGGYHRLDLFGEVTEDDIGVRQTVGNYKMTPGESVLNQATTIAPYTDVELHGRVDLDWAVANCGVIREVNDADVTYYMHITLEVRKGDSNAFSTLSPIIQFNTVSSVVFFASSADTVKIDIQQLRDVDGEFTLTNVRTYAATTEGEFVDVTIPACGAFETRRAWVVREAWKSNIADSIVGLRDLRDVSMVYNGGRDPSMVGSNGEQMMGSPTNAFGTRPVAVSPPLSCPNSECITLIYFITDCNAYSYGVNTLNWASFQPVERQVTLMGGTLQAPEPWPGTDGLRTSLDNIHNFYHYPQKWSIQYETFPPVASPVGSDIDGVHPDPVLININLDTRVMDGIYEGNVHFQCGILREPENPTIEGNMIVLFSTNPAAPVEASAIAEAARSPHLADNGMLAVACAVEPAMRNSFTMIIDVLETTLSPYRMTPVDSRGVMATEPDGSPTTQSLTWWDLKTVSTYTPRQVEPLRLAPAAQGVPGVDVVGTLVYWLHKLLPSPGFQLDFSAKVVFPSTSVHDGSPNVYKALSLTLTKSANTLSVASRTLLQTGGSGSSSNSTDTPANSGSPSMFVGIPPNPNNTDWRSLQIIDLQSPSTRTKIETALTMSLALGLMTVIGSMAMIKLPVAWTISRVF